jgi:hypothetical protein
MGGSWGGKISAPKNNSSGGLKNFRPLPMLEEAYCARQITM